MAVVAIVSTCATGLFNQVVRQTHSQPLTYWLVQCTAALCIDLCSILYSTISDDLWL